jgi:DNA-binding HxlR family transcriptional regulator
MWREDRGALASLDESVAPGHVQANMHSCHNSGLAAAGVGEEMTAAPVDRALEVLGEPTALLIVRALATQPATQGGLVAATGLGQSSVSRALKSLRSVGLVESDTPRGALRLRAPGETIALMQAANNLAEAVLQADHDEQRALSQRTRRAAIRPARSSARSAS